MTDLIKYQGASKRMAKEYRYGRIFLWNNGIQEAGNGQLAGYWICDGFCAVQLPGFAKILSDRAIFPELPEPGKGVKASRLQGNEGSIPDINAIIPRKDQCKPLTLTPWLYMGHAIGNCFVLEFEDKSITIVDAKVMAVLGETRDDLEDFKFYARDNKSPVLVMYAGDTFAVLMPMWLKDHTKVPSLPTLSEAVPCEVSTPVVTSKYRSIASTDSKGRAMTILVKSS